MRQASSTAAMLEATHRATRIAMVLLILPSTRRQASLPWVTTLSSIDASSSCAGRYPVSAGS